MPWCAAEICRHRVPTRLIAPRSALDNPHSRAVPAVRSGHRGWLAGSPARCTWQDRWLARRRESGGLGGSWSPDGRHASGVAGQPSRRTARRADAAPLRRHDPARCRGPAAAIRAHSAHPAAEVTSTGDAAAFRRVGRAGPARRGRILRPAAALDKVAVIMAPRSRSSWRRAWLARTGHPQPVVSSPAARPLSARTRQRRCGVFAGREQPTCEQLIDRCAMACQPVRDVLSTSWCRIRLRLPGQRCGAVRRRGAYGSPGRVDPGRACVRP